MSHGTQGKIKQRRSIATSIFRLESRSLYYDDDDDDDDDDAAEAHADSDDDSLRVACYPRAPVSHVTLGRPCHMLSPSGRVTCYPGRPGVARRRRKIPQWCEGAKGEGDEDGELDPATQSRKALV